MSWQADQIQVPLFTVPGAPQVEALDVWKLATANRDPDAYQRANPAALMAGSTAHGTIDGKRLIVSAQLGRLDLTLLGEPKQDYSAPAHLGDFADAIASVREFARPVFEATRLVRFGLIGNFTEISETDAAVARRLSEVSGGIWFPDPPLDCVYQVNRRMNYMARPEIEMNRVLTWSAGAFQLLQQPAIGQIFTAGFSNIRLPIVSFKADLNTATMDVISKDAFNLFEETEKEMLRLYERGIQRLRDE